MSGRRRAGAEGAGISRGWENEGGSVGFAGEDRALNRHALSRASEAARELWNRAGKLRRGTPGNDGGHARTHS